MNRALDALLEGLSVVAAKAAEELGSSAEDAVASHAVKLSRGGKFRSLTSSWNASTKERVWPANRGPEILYERAVLLHARVLAAVHLLNSYFMT